MADTESLKIHEAHEHAAHSHSDPALAPVSFTMAILAVLIAAVSLMGHRAHNEILLAQLKTNFQKAELVEKETQRHADEILLRLLGAVDPTDPARAAAQREKLVSEIEDYRKAEEQVKEKAFEFEHESGLRQRQANRFDVGELFLEMGLVLCSITLLTRRGPYWIVGTAGAAVGLIIAVSGFWAR